MFWQTVVRENQDPAGIVGVSDLLNYHFVDPGITFPGEWQEIRFNREQQKWQRE
jgi:hypothetical protein